MICQALARAAAIGYTTYTWRIIDQSEHSFLQSAAATWLRLTQRAQRLILLMLEYLVTFEEI